MDIVELRCKRFLRALLAVVLLVGFSGATWGQTQGQPAQPSTPGQKDPNQNQGQSQNLPDKPALSGAQGSAQPAPATAPPTASEEKEVKITPHEAEELFHSVDEILAFDSQRTGLPIKKQVKRRLTSRDQVVAYLAKHMKDDDVKRLQRSELVLKKFGLLPRDYDMGKLLLDWVPMEEQEPVLAHELTHALQDQSVGLDKWMKRGEKDLGEMKKDPTPEDIDNDEMDDAREAVVEGQAQAVMFEYAMAPAGHSIADSPDLLESMEAETLTGTPGTKVFNDAPIFMQESLTFPYSYGLEFVAKLIQTGGKEKAFAGVLANPPHTTRQIMQPETYLSGEKIEPMHIPDFKRDFKDYLKFDIGAMGEFDVAVLIEQYAGKDLSKRLYPEWRGGYYYAAHTKSEAPHPDPSANPSVTAPLGLFYVSRWSSPEKASEFAGIYARSLEKRYKKAEEIATSGSGESAPQHPDYKIDGLKGRHSWTTEEGTIVIEEKGDTVLVSESLDAATTETLEKEVFEAGK